jgi:hypothetical protein
MLAGIDARYLAKNATWMDNSEGRDVTDQDRL